VRFATSDPFETAFTAACRLDVRVRDALEGVKFIIERRHEAYPLIPGTKVRLATFRMFTTMPELRLYYTVDSEPDGDYLCRLLALRGYQPLAEPPSGAYL
jgi:hypothetical protein